MRRTAGGGFCTVRAAAQGRDVPPTAEDKPDAGGIHKGDARKIQRQQLRQTVIYLGVDFPPDGLGGVVVDLAA